ncbi:hypothetical protein CAPTEDRAFT_139038 [Capitella teleta]|uniref:Cytochrome P450 n=1 Tax=Capitella teleta TaxID=283909 RepID=R7U8A1_CAPTE|nr:hypothetical protein CAPTEDRAFT_139038 [Capitella teleta]|eukprot:ELU02219.1 hypothetical protein CAPTEDRAFT_139038 [Capitella teleta]
MWTRRANHQIPHYKGWPMFGNLFQVNRERPELTFTEWAKHLGPVFSVKMLKQQFVVISSFEAIYETLVEKGNSFMSRSTQRIYRVDLLTENTEGISFMEPTPTWMKLKKTLHRKIRIYDTGMKRIEEINRGLIGNLVNEFMMRKVSFNPKEIIFNTVMNTILALLLGKTFRADEELFKNMMKFEQGVKLALSSSGKGTELDIFPWLRFFGNQTYKLILELKEIRNRVWELMKKEAALGDQMLDGSEKDFRLMTALKEVLTEKDSGLSEGLLKTVVVLDLVFAGTTTTANTLYIYLNIISQHPDVQGKLQEEVDAVVGSSRCVSLADKEDMPYTQATMFELLRFTTVAVFAPPHTSHTDATLQGHVVPAGVLVLVNLFALHHDEEFWKNPYEFQPERFLDEHHQLLPASHPNRRHLLPFGAGPRLCIGEALAKSRLFLVISSLAQKFNIHPGDVTTSCDPRVLLTGPILSSRYFEIIAKERS